MCMQRKEMIKYAENQHLRQLTSDQNAINF